MSLIEPPISNPAQNTTDQQIHIYCPDCDYDVTIQPENRCPECGQEFDRDRLRDWACQSELSPTMGPRQNVRYVKLTMMALFQPTLLARSLPPHPSVKKAFWYAMVLRLLPLITGLALAGILFIAAVWLTESLYFPRLDWFVFAHLTRLLASLICELVIAALLAWKIEPRGVMPGKRFRFWYATCCCFCIYFFVRTSFTAGASFLSILVNSIHVADSTRIFVYSSLQFIQISTLLWWWHALGTFISIRGMPSKARTSIVFLIPIIGFVTDFVITTIVRLLRQ